MPHNIAFPGEKLLGKRSHNVTRSFERSVLLEEAGVRGAQKMGHFGSFEKKDKLKGFGQDRFTHFQLVCRVELDRTHPAIAELEPLGVLGLDLRVVEKVRVDKGRHDVTAEPAMGRPLLNSNAEDGLEPNTKPVGIVAAHDVAEPFAQADIGVNLAVGADGKTPCLDL